MAAVLLVSTATAQREQQMQGDALEELRQKAARQSTSIVQPAGIALEAPVDPEHYVVGPSDVIAVSAWGMSPISLVLTVTPEGTLVIPAVGEVRVADLTLALAKKEIVAAVRRRYTTGEVSATLMTPRQIVVMVTGSVLFPGLYTLTAVDRANRALEEANKAVKVEPRLDYRLILASMSTRNVVLKRRDGTMTRVDIQKFLATRDDRWNPFLREGDLVIVPKKDEDRNVIGVYGEVNAPGRYEYVDGDSLADAILIAQGFSRRAVPDSVGLVRLDSSRTSLVTRRVNARRILAGQEPNIPLQPGDRLVVPAFDDGRSDDRVVVIGEVRYPGTYPILRGVSTLRTAIRAAGGFTQRASLPRSMVSRKPVSSGNFLLDSIYSIRGKRNDQDEAFFFNESAIRNMRELVAVDFVRLFVAGDSLADVVLQPDDTVRVPVTTNTVYVFGQVVRPGHIAYAEGQSPSYYVKQAGGYLDMADRSSIRVIKGATQQWLDPYVTTVEEGDYLWVPKEQDRPFGYYLAIVGQVASVLSIAITTLVLTISLSK